MQLLYLRLLSYVRPYWKVFVIAIICMGVSSALEPAFPALMKYLLDDGFANSQGGWDWLIYPLVIFAVFVIRALIGFVADYAMNWVSQNVVLELRTTMFSNMLRLPVQYYTDNMSGRLLSRISNDVAGVAIAATTALTTLVKDSISILGLLGWLLYLNWKLTLITLAMVPFIAYTVGAFNQRIRNLARKGQTATGELIQILQESIEGHKVVKVFGGQAYETERFKKISQLIRGVTMRDAVAAATQGPIVQFFSAAALAIIMGVALRQASNGTATVGDFVSFITAMMMILPPTRRLSAISGALQKGLIAAESVFHLIDLPPELDNGTISLAVARGDIEFQNISFTYPGTPHQAVDDLTFSISPGECVALVGASGSGKSTVANLLPRFYAPDAGTIRVDGHPISDITLKSLRDNIALVSQDVVLFNDSVAANIAYGTHQGVSRDDVVKAAIAANALQFIELMPQGLDTPIGENGVKLSGGQRQRIAIARALLKDAPILILDEATSALDTESERLVQEALNKLMVGRSTLVIAHRLSTVEHANKIIVMSHGKKVEEGTHTQLLDINGVYARLYHRQQDEVLGSVS